MTTARMVADYKHREYQIGMPVYLGHAQLYQLEPPPMRRIKGDVDEKFLVKYVLVLLVPLARGRANDSFIFPSDEHGMPLDWDDVDTAMTYARSHAEVLKQAGYEVTP